MEVFFGQIVLAVANSGIPVLVGNLLKNFFPKMDGKTGVIVNWLTIVLFAWAWGYAEIYDPNFLYDVLPGIEYQAKEWIEWVNAVVVGMVALGLNKPLYMWVKGKFGILSKSFSKPAA